MKNLALLSAVAVLACVACSSAQDVGVPMPTNDPIAPGELSFTQTVSKCGGFAATATPSAGALFDSIPSPTFYCDAERLHWSYDATQKTLKLTNARVMLNCCGEHTTTAKTVDGTIVVTEVDDPVMNSGHADRCGCMCVFDYSIAIANVDPGTVHLRIDRNVTDSKEGVQVAWTGDLDVSKSSGSIVINETSAGYFCAPH